MAFMSGIKAADNHAVIDLSGDSNHTIVKAFHASTSKKVTNPSKRKQAVSVKNAAPAAKIRKTNSKEVTLDLENALRISDKLTISALKAECKARGLKGYSTMGKGALVEFLTPGTLCVSKHEVYIQYCKLWSTLKAEETEIKEKKIREKVAEANRKERELREEAERKMKNFLENNGEIYALVHKSNLYDYFSLRDLGNNDPRPMCNVRTELCDTYASKYAPDTRFGACDKCIKFKSGSNTVQANMLAEKKKEEALAKKREEERRKQEEEEMKSEPWYKKKMRLESFPKRVKDLSKKNKDRNKVLKFVVYSIQGYTPDGFHSYQGPLERTFDSSWSNLSDANKRAELVFYKENPWGWTEEDFFGDYSEVEETLGGDDYPSSLEMLAGDGEEWKVKVQNKNQWS